MALAQDVLALARAGFRVLPLHKIVLRGGSRSCSCSRPNCDSPGKHPLTKHGVDDASSDTSQIQAWWHRWPDANVAIATGSLSGVDVLDIDGDAGRSALASLEAEHGAMPWTIRAKTGKGEHYFFAHDDRVWNRVSLCPGIDIRTEGGYVVGPPSIHVTGNNYEWRISPDDADPAPWPEWLVQKLLDLRKATTTRAYPVSTPVPRNPDAPTTIYTAKVIGSCYSEMEAARAPSADAPGNRNDTLNRLAYILGQLDAAGEAIGDALSRLKSIAISKGLSQQEADETADRAFAIGKAKPRVIRSKAAGGTTSSSRHEPQDVEIFEREGEDGVEEEIYEEGLGSLPAAEALDMAMDVIRSPIAIPPPAIKVVAYELNRMANEAEAALIVSGLPIYQRFGELVRVKKGERLSVDMLPEPQVLKLLTIAATWWKWDDKEEEEVRTTPPKDVVKVLATQGEYGLRELVAIYDVPTMRPDGTVLQDPGYDAATKSIYQPRMNFPKVPENPTLEDAEAAFAKLVDPVQDFPFVAPSDRSSFVALVLTVLGRPAIDGPTPLFVVRATDRGVGKSLLVDVVSLITTGAIAARMTHAGNPEEEGKRLLALGLESTPLAMIDNVDVPLGGDVLAAATTAKTYKGRFLGVNKMVEVPVPVLVATGVNLAVQEDLGRRVIPIDMNPRVEDPEKRKGFKYPHLTAHVSSIRADLAVAGLTILRAFHLAGRPETQGLDAYGSFEAWSMFVRMAVTWCDQEDPCAGRAKVRAEGDLDRDTVLHFLETWYDRFGFDGSTVHDALAMAKSRDNELLEAMVMLDPKGNADRFDSRRAGWCFRKIQERVVGPYTLFRIEKKTKKGAAWRVIMKRDEPEQASPPSGELPHPGHSLGDSSKNESPDESPA